MVQIPRADKNARGADVVGGCGERLTQLVKQLCPGTPTRFVHSWISLHHFRLGSNTDNCRFVTDMKCAKRGLRVISAILRYGFKLRRGAGR
jgi:hypothetical protein